MGPPRKPRSAWLPALLMPLGILAAVLLVISLVVRPGGAPSPLIIGGILGLLFAWVVVSALWPARADRTCPQCQAESLERLDPKSAVGLCCSACGWSDATASAWYHAEEELEELEPLALQRRAAQRAARQPKLDIPSRSD